MTNSKPKLELHFDVNKTVILIDPIQGKTVEDLVNESISFLAWGSIEKTEPPSWKLVGNTLSESCPAEGLVSYADFVTDILFPTPKASKDEPKDVVNERNKANRKKRNNMKVKFTEDGSPGTVFRSVYSQTLEALQCGKNEDGTAKFHTVLPSFFNLLKWLDAEKRDYSIVLRTFGTDGDRVGEEMNSFYRGEHQLSGAKGDGTAGSVDHTVVEKGVMYRTGPSNDETCLIVGTNEEVPMGEKGATRLEELAKGGHHIIRGYKPIMEWIRSKGANGRTVVLRDSFAWWNANNENEHSGKLFAYDSKRDKVEPKENGIFSVFFDDNLRTPDPQCRNIVDARDISLGDPYVVSAYSLLGSRCVKVNPISAVVDGQYFINHLIACEKTNHE